MVRSTALALALLVSGCASGGAADNPFGGRGSNEIRITVVNDNLRDVTIYAVATTIRQRLGRVSSHRQETFTLTWATTRELQLELDFVGTGRCYSRPLVVSPGDELELNIGPSLTRFDCRR